MKFRAVDPELEEMATKKYAAYSEEALYREICYIANAMLRRSGVDGLRLIAGLGPSMIMSMVPKNISTALRLIFFTFHARQWKVQTAKAIDFFHETIVNGKGDDDE
jgi:hypothetical protein